MDEKVTVASDTKDYWTAPEYRKINVNFSMNNPSTSWCRSDVEITVLISIEDGVNEYTLGNKQSKFVENIVSDKISMFSSDSYVSSGSGSYFHYKNACDVNIKLDDLGADKGNLSFDIPFNTMLLGFAIIAILRHPKDKIPISLG